VPSVSQQLLFIGTESDNLMLEINYDIVVLIDAKKAVL
jgi:hypothetical protein